VHIPELIAGKTYLFFSHTAKEQPYNRELLQTILEKRITLIDYEYLTRPDHTRVVAFGKWAGIVGAYNGLKAFGERKKLFELKPAWQLSGLEEMKADLADLDPGKAKFILTGGGRVAMGAVEILKAAGIREVSPQAYLNQDFEEAVFSRLDPWHYAAHADGKEFSFEHFLKHPSEYKNAFIPYAKRSDMYMACHFWDPDAPVLLSREDMMADTLNLEVIADISCDIDGPIASTVRASTIADPLFGYDPAAGKESADVFGKGIVTVMAVDNLPGELPRDASTDFGEALIQNVLPSLLEEDKEGVVKRATIAANGALTPEFNYLQGYVKGS
jgi:hypothetical protein